MKKPRTIIGGVLGTRWFLDPWRRRLTFAVLALVLAVLCIWPRHYMAKAQLLPEAAGNGLSAALSQTAGGGLVSLGALIGQSQSIESELTVSRSEAVLNDVLRGTDFARRRGFHSPSAAAVALRKKVDLAAVRGSILQIQVTDGDPDLARSIAAEYAAAVQQRLGDISRVQAAEKRRLAQARLSEASTHLSQAQAALNQFRSANQLAEPTTQLGAAVTQVASLEGELRAKEVELNTLREFATPQNVQYKMAEAEIESLRRQVALSQQSSQGTLQQPTALAERQTQYLNLYRDEQFAQILYEVYTRYLEQVTVEELSAANSMVLVEPAYVDPARQYNTLAVALLVFLVLCAIGAEFYLARPPVGERLA